MHKDPVLGTCRGDHRSLITTTTNHHKPPTTFTATEVHRPIAITQRGLTPPPHEQAGSPTFLPPLVPEHPPPDPPDHYRRHVPRGTDPADPPPHRPPPPPLPLPPLPPQLARPHKHRQRRDRRFHEARRPGARRPQRLRRPLLRRLCRAAAGRRRPRQARWRRAVGRRRYGLSSSLPLSLVVCADWVKVGWAFLTAMTAFVRTRGQLLALRTMIGALEAGFYPTTVFYLGLFYTRYEFAQRLGMFFGQYAVAGAFGGLVSWGVFKLFPGGEQEAAAAGNTGGLHAYQVMFLLEGSLTLVVALTTFWWLPLGPRSAWWLHEGDREWAEKRVLLDRARAGEDEGPKHRHGSESQVEAEEEGEELLRGGEDQVEDEVVVGKSTLGGEAGLTRRDVKEAFGDWKIWWILAVNIASSVPASAFSVFLPLVIKGMGHPPLTANLLTVPPFLCGAFTLWGITYLSDRARRRIKYILIGLGISVVGLALVVLLPPQSSAARYLALCVLLAGSYVASPLTVAWLSGNISEPGKRAVALGINGWGNLAGVLSARLYAPEYAPGYRFSFAVTLALVLAAWVGYWAFERALGRENACRERRCRDWTAREMAAEMAGKGGRRGDERWGVRYGF